MKVKTLDDIYWEVAGISNSLNALNGQMNFFNKLIEDVEQYKDGMAMMLRSGDLEKQMDAIYTLFYYELNNIEKSQKKIKKLLEQALHEAGS